MKTALVDRQDLARVLLFGWLAKEDGRGIWHIYTDVDGAHYALDQMIMGCNMQQSVDHLNNDPFDCRSENLEIVSLNELISRRMQRIRQNFDSVQYPF